MLVTKEIKAKIMELKPKRGIASFSVIDKKNEVIVSGEICKCGWMNTGSSGYRTTMMEVSNNYWEVYSLCPMCDETEYCSTVPRNGAKGEAYMREDRKVNYDVIKINL